MTENLSPSDWLSALWDTHRRLDGAVIAMSPDALVGPSYDTEWSIAQVLSHIGSGAEIFVLFLDAGLDGEPAPGMDAFKSVWSRWDAKSPEQTATDALQSNRAFLERVDAMDPEGRDEWSLEFFGSRRSLRDLLWFRLAELALHTWDVIVEHDHDAEVTSSAVDLLIDVIGQFAAMVAKAPSKSLQLRIDTSEPERSFDFVVADGKVSLKASSSSTGADVLWLSSEALIRLVYGRLDPSHTPAHRAHGVDLDQLRAIFPGV